MSKKNGLDAAGTLLKQLDEVVYRCYTSGAIPGEDNRALAKSAESEMRRLIEELVHERPQAGA